MAGPIDEEFTERCVSPGTVLDFGCSPGVFTARLSIRTDLRVTGIDLYPASVTEGYEFVQADVLDYNPSAPFETVCCVSSFEHAGIESRDFRDGRTPDLSYHLRVAKKLETLVAPGGQLIVTCPFGPDEVWFTHEGRDDFRPDADLASLARWGYRTYSIQVLSATFSGLRLQSAEAHEHLAGDYFDRSTWVQVDAFADVSRYDSPKRRAVLCVVFRR